MRQCFPKILPTICCGALLLLMLSGCSTIGGSQRFPQNVEIPGGGGPIEPGLWQGAEQYGPGSLPTRYWIVRWFFPTSIYNKTASFESDSRLRVSRTLYQDLLFPIFLVPMQFKTSHYIYDKSQSEPVAGDWVSWNVFWADEGQVGGGIPGREVSAAGVPLFFGIAKTRDREQTNMMWNSLWSLGPAFYSVNVTPSQQEVLGSQARPREASISIFCPVALGGIPGLVLWTDLTIERSTAEGTNRMEAHGPLGGSLGMLQARTKTNKSDELLRLVMFGALWYDKKEYVDTEEEQRDFAAHGPLWSMFGWGRKDGKNAVRLFFVPIVLPGQ